MSIQARVRSRPLSPRFAIYRFTTTMIMSIVHRLTGIALYLATLLLSCWLLKIGINP